MDEWHSNYKGAPEDGRAWINEEAKENKNKFNVRLLRGGSWHDRPAYCRSAFRSSTTRTTATASVGFRVCCLPQDLFFTL
jgi:formylglycine-generating enzyme required for sulfatase activity